MYLVRLWVFTERIGEFYPEGGTYDTSVIDVDTGNCGDPQQFDRFQAMMEYSGARGEELQEVESPEEAYTLCSRQRYSLSSQQCGGGVTTNPSTMNAAILRPTNTCNVPYLGGGSRTTPPPAPCPPVPPTVDPTIMSAPVVQTLSDHAQRIIALARRNRIVPTIVY